ncbi:MAG: N-acyl homoserine lactonase family protein [Propionicimonas sp.]|uniref:N-acyl homoserine lactonase family protein n=1 Tax=Propionicimonas sp. TaxID=1955623 RepID=UPI002B201811|nr:N-acyl homoserine lactonase family protein [Propionicimonas sp.]MEA4943316.1 N-acyl homoserine lactonase family protein [Propionicimonas sp.]
MRNTPIQAGHDAYELLIVRYATKTVDSTMANYYCADIYAAADSVSQMDYYFWVARNSTRTVLIDCGFDGDRASHRGEHHDHDPLDTLTRLGIKPDDVDAIILSHMHYDHAGNIDKFPQATVLVSQREFDFWTGPLAGRPVFAWTVETTEIDAVRQAGQQGRLRLIGETEEVFPGITVSPIGGHTPGMALTTVATAAGLVVLASDAIHFYDEMDLDRPFFLFSDLPEMYEGYGLLRSLGEREDTVVIAGHDPAAFSRFTPLCGELGDYVGRLGSSLAQPASSVSRSADAGCCEPAPDRA